MKKINPWTAVGLVVFVLGIAALAAWGDQLGMSAGALRWVQACAAAIGLLVMAQLPKLVEDKDGDGIPDIIEKSAPLLVLAFLAASASSCTAAQTRQATTVGRDVLAWTCAPAKKICEMFATSTEFGVSACAAIETACDIGGVMLNSAPAPVEAEQPHDLSVEP